MRMSKQRQLATVLLLLSGCVGRTSSSPTTPPLPDSSAPDAPPASQDAGPTGSQDAGPTGSQDAGPTGSQDAGPAGSQDASPPPASPPCNALFCENFEGGPTLSSQWKVYSRYPAMPKSFVEVQSGMVAHGNYAVHFHKDSTDDDIRIALIKDLPALRDHVFGRAFMWIADSSAGHSPYFTAGLSCASCTGTPCVCPYDPVGEDHFEVAQSNGAFQTTIEGSFGERPGGGGQVPSKAWTCVEWEFDRLNNAINIWRDGASQATFHDTGDHSPLVSAFNVFTFGYARTPVAVEMYVDDIALDTQRIGCPQ
jgi:hypothetical protein